MSAERAKRTERARTTPRKVRSARVREAPAEPTRAVPKGRTAPRSRPAGRVPVVGIGASAGGLEALEVFLKNVPSRSGLAFVVIQHRDLKVKGMLVELLQRATKMPVTQVVDRVRVQADRVYVIPPGFDLSILRGALHALPQATGVPTQSIDFFFRSLADDRGDSGFGVVLSGTGSDGTAGLRAIRERGGTTFVQTPDSAKFDGMPRSAIDAGSADVVAAVAAIPGRILAYRQRPARALRASEAGGVQTEAAIEKVCVLLRAHTGADFSLYKGTTIRRRLERRMGIHQIGELDHYVRFLRENPRELDLLFKELLIGVTSFFRDPAAWDHLRDQVLRPFLEGGSTGGALRAWVAGCSTGEEAYSLAIVFREVAESLRPQRNFSLQIFATDLDRDAVEKARRGHYPSSIAQEVSPERLSRWFLLDEKGYRVRKEIREMMIFAPQNLSSDPPFTKLDLLTCRNVLIYLSAELQKTVIPILHYSLKPGGILFLGCAETVGSFSGLFTSPDTGARVYRKLERSLASVPVDFPSIPRLSRRREETDAAATSHRASGLLPNLQALVDHALVERVASVGILCTEKGDILYISGRAGRYLEPAVGKANLNVFAMANESLRHELSSAFSAALRRDLPVNAPGLRISGERGAHRVNLTVQRLTEEGLKGTVMIVLTEVPATPAGTKATTLRAGSSQRFTELEEELQHARAEAQTTREDVQTSQEELNSTNEELQSANEELQSTNEELTTSTEELQSLNEELQTLNQELRSRVDDLSRSSNDLNNLLDSTDIATLFLDPTLRVRRFTTPTSRIIKLIPTDAGRPITDIVSELDYPGLADDARGVLKTGSFVERQAVTRDGQWYTVRILPYRTREDGIDGVVITFNDASTAKSLERALRDQSSQLRQMADSLPNLVWGCRADGTCDYLGRKWVEYTGIPESEQLGHRWLEQIDDGDRDRVRAEWTAAVEAGVEFSSNVRVRRADGTTRHFAIRAVPIRNAKHDILKWYGTATDLERERSAEPEARS